MKIVVGLGNPGRKYDSTRHNVGFAVVDALAAGTRVSGFQGRFDAQVAELHEENEKVLLLKPETLMNASGRCVRQALDFYQAAPADLLVVCDDINLPLGKLRFRARGTHGGHNGLRDISQKIASHDYWRMRIGIGHPGDKDLGADWVLQKPSADDRTAIDESIDRAVAVVPLCLAGDLQGAMLKLHTQEKGAERAAAAPAAPPPGKS